MRLVKSQRASTEISDKLAIRQNWFYKDPFVSVESACEQSRCPVDHGQCGTKMTTNSEMGETSLLCATGHNDLHQRNPWGCEVGFDSQSFSLFLRVGLGLCVLGSDLVCLWWLLQWCCQPWWPNLSCGSVTCEAQLRTPLGLRLTEHRRHLCQHKPIKITMELSRIQNLSFWEENVFIKSLKQEKSLKSEWFGLEGILEIT